MRISLLIISIFIGLLAVTPSYGNCENFSQGVAKLSGVMPGGVRIKSDIQTIKVNSEYPYARAFSWGGDERVAPKTIIKAIDVLIGDEHIGVPLSAYSDLGDPRQALLEVTRHGFKLIIIGGDAAVSYKAVLTFDNDNIQRRKVTSGEFPDEVWEETTYSFIHKREKM